MHGSLHSISRDAAILMMKVRRDNRNAMRSSRAIALFAALVASALAPRVVGAQIAVVVSAANPIDELSADQLKRLFLGQGSTFPGGQHARLARQAPSAMAFDRTALNLQPEIVRSRWMTIVFRGEATAMPAAFESTDDVKKFLQEHADGITYLPLAAVDASMKVLRIDGRKPSDPAYPIR